MRRVLKTAGILALAAIAAAAFVSCPGSVPVITISTQPAATVNVTAEIITGNLSVEASVTGRAAPEFQWFRNTTASNTFGTPIDGATAAVFSIPTDLAAGRHYFFAEVRANGAEPVRSDVAAVVVAVRPVITITTQPESVMLDFWAAVAGSLTVEASVTAGAVLEFQWFTDNSPISGATGASFALPADLAEGSHFFFVEVRASGGAEPVRSDTATVHFIWPPLRNVNVPRLGEFPIYFNQGHVNTQSAFVVHNLAIQANDMEGRFTRWLADLQANNGDPALIETVGNIATAQQEIRDRLLAGGNPMGATGGPIGFALHNRNQLTESILSLPTNNSELRDALLNALSNATMLAQRTQLTGSALTHHQLALMNAPNTIQQLGGPQIQITWDDMEGTRNALITALENVIQDGLAEHPQARDAAQLPRQFSNNLALHDFMIDVMDRQGLTVPQIPRQELPEQF